MKNNQIDPALEVRKIALEEWMQAGSGIKQRIQNTLIDDQLDFDSFRVLQCLNEVEGRTIGLDTIAKQINHSEKFTYQLLELMQSNKWLNVQPGLIKGTFQVTLKTRGRRLYQKLDKRISLELAPIAAQFNPKELKLMRLLLNKVIEVFTPTRVA